MPHEHRVRVERSGRHVIRDEFDNQQDRFDADMRRMDQEMGRLRQEFESHHHSAPKTAMNTAPAIGFHQRPREALTGPPPSGTTFSRRSDIGEGADQMAIATRSPPPNYNMLQSPLIREETDGKSLRLRFNVTGYAPEEVSVKMVDNKLMVQALHVEKAPGKSVHREFNQDFLLPRGTNPESITSSLSVDGVLMVEAPLPRLAIGN